MRNIEERLLPAPKRDRQVTPPAHAHSSLEPVSPEPVSSDLESLPAPINYRFLLVTSIAMIACFVAINVIHERQVERLAAESRAWGIQARKLGDTETAIRHLRRYLDFAPNDIQAIEGLAFSIAETAEAPKDRYRAIQLLERILRDSPESTAVRTKLVEMLREPEFQRDNDAIIHLQHLLQSDPKNPDLLASMGQSLERMAKFQNAAKFYELAIQAAPRNPSHYEDLVRVLHEHLESTDEAEEVLTSLVLANPKDPFGYLIRSRFRFDQGKLREARIDAVRAYQLAPDDVEICVLLVDLIVEAPWPSRPVSTDALKRTLANTADSDELDHLASLALVHLQLLDGEYEMAEQQVREILVSDPASEMAQCLYTDILTLQGDVDAARDATVDLESQFGRRAYLSDFLNARIEFMAGNWHAAASLFRRVFDHELAPMTLRTRAGLRMAECWEQTGHFIREHRAYLDLLRLNPDSERAATELGDSYREFGQLEEAIRQYERLGDHPIALASIAEIKIQQYQSLPEAKQRWQEVDAIIDRLANIEPRDSVTLRLRAELLYAKRQHAAAIRLLQRELQVNPEDQQLWLTLLQIYSNLGDRQAAIAMLDQIDESTGDAKSTLDARVRFAASARNVEEMEALHSAIDALPLQERLLSLRTLGAAWRDIGEYQKADECWSTLREHAPHDLSVLRAQITIATLRGDDDRSRKLIGQMREIEGQNGEYWQLAEAARLYALAERGQRDRLSDARQILESLEGQVLDGARVKTLLGDICQLEGDLESAMEHYSSVVDRGVSSRHCVLQLARLMYQRGEFAEVGRLIRRFEQSTSTRISASLAQLGTLASLQESELGEAVRFAEFGANSQEESLDGQIWLGQVYQLAGRFEQAETHFRHAIAIAPDQPAGWIALSAFLQASNRVDDLMATIAEAETAVSAPVVNVTLAQCYDVAGLTEKAAAYYQRALAAGIQSEWELTPCVGFYVRTGQTAPVKQLLRELIDKSRSENPQLVALARRMLAELLADSGEYAAHRQALALLDENSQGADTLTDRNDLRLKARLLASSPLRVEQREAVQMYEELKNRGSLSVQDAMTLAQLYEAVRDYESAENEVFHVVARSPKDPRVLVFAISFLLNRDGHQELLADLISRLQTLRPQEIETIALSTRWLIKNGKIQEALTELRSAVAPHLNAPDHDQPREHQIRLAQAVDEIAKSLDRSGRLGPAEDFAVLAEQLYLEAAVDDPASQLQLVRFYLRFWRIDEALQTCHRLRDVVADEHLARVYVQLLRTQQIAPPDAEEIRTWIESRWTAQPKSSPLHLSHAHALALAKDYEAALKSYQLLIEHDPQNVEALNEAALLIVLLNGNANEASGLINRAIQEVGPIGSLVDTRAAVELALGDPKAAVMSAETAIAESPSSVRYFRMAQAHFASGETSQARDELQLALQLGLHASSLHPLEVSKFRQLRSELRL